jgi:hypothetical protein
VLVQHGLVQLSGWPGLAWLVLGIVLVMLILLTIIGLLFYLVGSAGYGFERLLSWIFKKEPPKRAFPLRVIDRFMGMLFTPVAAVVAWFYERKEKKAPTPQYTGDHASFKEIFDTITEKATDPNARQE